METTSLTGAKRTVLSFIDALNEQDYQTARLYASDDIFFKGVLGEREGADAYFADMEKMKFSYDIQKTFVDGNDVCLWYNITMSGTTVLCCGWYKVEEGKIQSFRVIFDPRPILGT